MSDCLIIGGGVIGLSLAYELAGQGLRVRVIDAGQPGREASWAGAGILPPAPEGSADPLEQLTALSNDLHRQWAQRLRDETGVDTGYRACGAIYLAREPDEAQRLNNFAGLAESQGITAQRVSPAELSGLEPELRPGGSLHSAYHLPQECQIRNPRHLKALTVGCLARGVEVTAGAAAVDFELRGERIVGVRTALGTLAAERVCLTTGSWTAALASRLGINAAIRPIRGQIALLTQPRPLVARIVNEGPRYLVPRADGRLLVGATEEDAGFDRGTTAGALAGLLEFAFGLVPGLQTATLERHWAGLRPSTADGLPYLGRIPGLENAFIAAGHFRSGLQLSTGTAVVMSQLIRGETPQIDLHAFRANRAAGNGAHTGHEAAARHLP